MNKVNKQGQNILKNLFSNIRNRVSLLVSLCLMSVLSAVLISSFLLSDLTLEKLAKTQYFQNKITKILKENEVYSQGLISIQFSELSSADINVEQANLSNLGNLVGYNIDLKVDFIKYWLGLSFIDEVFIKKVVYSFPNNFSVSDNDIKSPNLKSLTQSIHAPLKKINSKRIFIDKGTIRLKTQVYDFSNIYIVKNKKLLTAKAKLKVKPYGDELIYRKSKFVIKPNRHYQF